MKTISETIAKSIELDQLLASPLRDGTMPEIGGKKLVGELGGLFADIRATLAEAKLGIVGAASELMAEVRDLKHVEKAIRSETTSVQQFRTQILGNATLGDNEDMEATKPPPLTNGGGEK